MFIILIAATFTNDHISRSRRDTTNKPSHEDMLLVQSIQITDKFGFDKQQQHQPKTTGYDSNETVFISGDAAQGYCVNVIGKLNKKVKNKTNKEF